MPSSVTQHTSVSLDIPMGQTSQKLLALCAAQYVSPRTRRLSPEEAAIRLTAYALKLPSPVAIEIAAPLMAALIKGPCRLVPVPASNGSITANFALARAIAKLVRGSRVICAIRRARPVESSCKRRLSGLLGLAVDQHAILGSQLRMQRLPLYFVDNVITTGNTIKACKRALGQGVGLIFADARRNSKKRAAAFANSPEQRLAI